jgi:signal transduction histidine kinase/ligand-binding sensor domain-containing protein/DNA-binding response OmpR family regulator
MIQNQKGSGCFFTTRKQSAVGIAFLWLTLLAIIWSQSLSAQEKLLPVFHFNQLTTVDGLPTDEIRSNIVQDRQGFIWIGTVKGLVRYDGYSCKIYGNDTEDPTSLSSIGVIALHCDRKGRLWVGTWETGLSLYDPMKDRFINFLPRQGDSNWLQAKTINVIHEDKQGNIWLGTMYEGIVRVHFDTEKEETSIDSIKRHIHFHTYFPGGKRNDIWDIKEFGDNKIIVASLGGLYCIDTLGRVTPVLNLRTNSGSILDTAITTCLFWEYSTKLWIGTPFQGLFLYDIKNGTTINYHKRQKKIGKLRNDPIRDIQMDGNGRLWIGTETSLDLFDISKSKYLDYLKFSVVPAASMLGMKLSLDNMGTLWIGTGDNGVYFLKPKSFRFPNYGLKGDGGIPKEMETIDRWNDGTYWVGTEGKMLNVDLNGLNVLRTVDLFHGEKSKYSKIGVWDSNNDKNGNFWYGTWGLGLYKFEPGTGRVSNFRYTEQLIDLIYKANICRSITFGDSNELYVAAYNDGLLKFDIQKEKFSKITKTWASHVMRDNEGKIWIANERDGLFVYTPSTGVMGQFVHEPGNQKSLSYSRTIQTYQDPQGRIWIGSRNVVELWEPETRSFKHYTNEEFKDAIYAKPLGSDSKGKLWVSYDGGPLGILDPLTGKFTNFGYSSGLCGFPSDMKLLKDGKVLLVGYRGMNIVNPDSLFTKLPPPPFVFTKMLINDTILIPSNKLSTVQKIDLSYQENVIEFEFAVIKPGDADMIEYRYRLEGLEESWIKPIDRRFVRYTALSPGNYTFRVKSISTRNEWFPQEIALAITILPPWWQTWWAYSFYGLAFIGLLFTGYRIRIKQLHLKQQMEMEHFQTERLAEVDKLKSRFFSNISHEFRTPLTLILGPADQVIETTQESSTRQKLNLIKDNAKKLFGLVNQLLDFSRLESGVMKLQASSGDVVGFLRRVVMSFESWAERKQIALEFRCETESGEGFFDADKLEKIMNNLMSNALKFTPDGGSVNVRFTNINNTVIPTRSWSESILIRPDSDADQKHVSMTPVIQNNGGTNVVISVADTGPGIPAEHLPNIFNRFYRADNSHNIEGTGIGLALVWELTQLHHGTVTVESSVGKGTTFTVTIPIDKSAYLPEEIVNAPPETEKTIFIEPPAVHKPSSTDIPTDGKPIVLVVEDNADLRAYIREFLDADYAVYEAGDGKAGLERATETIPDIVISDVMMPEMDGIELCKGLKQDVRTSHIPVILLTARAGTDNKIEGLEIGADDYVTKPFDSKELLARVKNLIEQRRQLRKKFSAGVVLKPGEVVVTSLDDALLKKVMEVVEKNISDENFGVEELAREACLSRAQLYRKIHALTNLSPAEFIRYVRLQRAHELLEKNTGTVADIAYRVGFGSPAHFSKCFHDRFGYPPSGVHTQKRKM